MAGACVTEGKATVHLPAGVFYNPVQQFNRDMTVAIIRRYEEIHRLDWLFRNIRNYKKYPDQGVRVYSGIRILEALAASGLRSVRFALEIPNIKEIVTNDLDPVAVELIKKNALHNNVKHITASCADAIQLMHSCKDFNNRFHVIDLDPYGTASPFLDSAVQCLHENGLLCVTCTDMAVLCGSSPGTAMGKYGGMAVKCSAVHEQALRILLHAIQAAASRHGKVIEPLISLSIDFYARVFVRLRTSPGRVKAIASNLGLLFTCNNCFSYHIQPLGSAIETQNQLVPRVTSAHGPPIGPFCIECGGRFTIGGPLWIGPLHSRDFINSIIVKMQPSSTPEVVEQKNIDINGYQKEEIKLAEMAFDESLTGVCLAEGLTGDKLLTTLVPAKLWGDISHWVTRPRILGMLSMAREELQDVVLYYTTDQLAGVIGCPMPKATLLRSALLNAGYRVSMSHAGVNSLKTDAPPSVVWDVFSACYHASSQASISKVNDANESDNCASDDKSSEDRNLLSKRAQRRSKRQELKKTCRPVPDSDASDGNDMEEGQEQKAVSVPPMLSLLRSKLRDRPLPTPPIDFSLHPLAKPESHTAGLLRFQQNPEPNWGPKSRAKVPKTELEEEVNEMTCVT